MTDEVGALVLRDNYLQSQAISLHAVRRHRSASASTRTSSARSSSRACSTARSSTCRAPRRSRTARRAGQGLTRPETRDAAVLLEDRAQQPADPLRRARGPVPGRRARPLLPGPAEQALREAARRAPAAARDHRHGDHQQHRQPHGPDLRVAHPAGHRRGRRHRRARLLDRPRGIRGARPVGRHRAARQPGRRGHAVRDDARHASR